MKIGLPRNNESQEKSNESKKHLTTGGLAERVGVSSRTIKHWEDKGIIEPDMRSEGGFRLYSQAFVYLCNLIKDLQLFGYTLEQIRVASDYFREFLAISENIEAYSKEETEKKLDTMLLAIKELTGKMTLLKEGISRWEDLINKKKKEINTLKRKNQKKENNEEIKGENHE
jgi:DNA-binding transcriptional MerR regulator